MGLEYFKRGVVLAIASYNDPIHRLLIPVKIDNIHIRVQINTANIVNVANSLWFLFNI